ncbi:hypothetical protein ACHWQZ_G001523 [Mnemiopsis leidyi]
MPAIRCSRRYDYSTRDQAFFLDTWNKLDVTETSGDLGEERSERPKENYFDTGLDVESALRRSKVPEEKTQTMSKKVTCSDSSRSSLPKFGLVEKYQLAFNIADLLKNNRFLCEEAAKRSYKGQRTQKRVRFAKVEIHEKHLPNCRRNSFVKHEFGHLHAPSCSNYKAEQALCKQEFLIRGNFIRENAKTVTSECDFYHTPVRPVEPLSPRLLTPAPLPTDGGLQLDLKNSTMDSITYHDRNSPNLRKTATLSLEVTEKASSSSKDSFAPKPNYRPMPCQPIFSDDIIIDDSPEVAVADKSELPLTTPDSQSNLPDSKVPEISVVPAGPASPEVCKVGSCDDLKLLPSNPERKLRSGSDSSTSDYGASSLDSGYDSKCGDFLDDFLNNMSDLSDSESESEDSDDIASAGVHQSTKNATTATNFSAGSTYKKDCDSESDTVVDGRLSSSSPPTSECGNSSTDSDMEEVEPDAKFGTPDSGIGSLSDNEDEIDDLIRNRHSVKPVPIRPHSWSTGPSKSEKPEVVSSKNEESADSVKQTFTIREGYFNPFSKLEIKFSVGLKKAPSVIGKLICDTRTSLKPVRNPDSNPDRFLFDSPSPDDVVRIRQSGIVTC